MKTKTDIIVTETGLDVSLPVAGHTVSLRRPTGKTLKVLGRLSALPDITDTDIMFRLLSELSGLQETDLEAMDAEDVACLGLALASFRVFSKLKTA